MKTGNIIEYHCLPNLTIYLYCFKILFAHISPNKILEKNLWLKNAKFLGRREIG